MASPIPAVAKEVAIVDGDRTERYGHPLDSFTKIAALWSVIVGTTVTPEMVGHCMIALKTVRCLQAGGFDEDSITDIKGYAYCLEKIAERKKTMAEMQQGFADFASGLEVAGDTTGQVTLNPHTTVSDRPLLSGSAPGVVSPSINICQTPSLQNLES